MPVDIISVEKLHSGYNSSKVLNDVTFNITKGDYVGLVGPNGSGKTTLIKTILGLFEPMEGNVSIFGERSWEFKDWHKVGYLPQKLVSFNPHFPATVKEIVALGLLSKKAFPRKIDRNDEMAINKALDLMDISDLKDKLIGELSGGQGQRVLLAKALVNEPDLLILDEPVTALDPETRERFFNILEELNQVNKVTIILVTHDIGTIGKYASKLLYLDKKIIFYGSFEDFCGSDHMTRYFGKFSQHIICHRHN